MIFEGNNMRVIVPLDPSEGARYTKPVREEYCIDDRDNIYRLTTKERDFIKPTAEEKLTWEHASSCASQSSEQLENWQNILHEVSIRRCARVTKSVRCIISEVCNLHSYDVLGDVNVFIDDYEEWVPEIQILLAFDIALKTTPARCWGTYKNNIGDWKEC